MSDEGSPGDVSELIRKLAEIESAIEISVPRPSGIGSNRRSWKEPQSLRRPSRL
jgi:hypothetical protein